MTTPKSTLRWALFSLTLLFTILVYPFFLNQESSDKPDEEPSQYPKISVSLDGLLDQNQWSQWEGIRRHLTAGNSDPKLLDQLENLTGESIQPQLRNDPDSLLAWMIRTPAKDNILYDYLKYQIPYQVSRAIDSTTDPGRRNLYFAWMWHELAMAAINGYQATGDYKYLDLVGESFAIIIEYRDDRLGIVDGYLHKKMASWGHQRPEDDCWWNEVTIPGRIAQPGAMFCHAVYQSDTLPMRFRLQANEFREELREVILSCATLYQVNSGGGYFVNNQLKRPDAINHINAFAAFLSIHQSIDSTMGISCRLEELESGFRQHFCQLDNGSITWPYFYETEANQSCDLSPEYSWKAQVSMYFPVFAWKYGAGFSQEEIVQCAHTFKQNIRQKDRFNSVIGANYIDFADAYDPQPYCIPGFAILAEYDPEIFTIIEETIAQRTDLIEYGWFSNRMTAMAYSYKLLIGK